MVDTAVTRRTEQRGSRTGFGWRSRHAIVVLTVLVALATGCSDAWKRDRHLKKGRRCEEEGKYSTAAIHYIKVLQRDASNAEAVRRLGLCYYKTGELRRAAACFTQVCELEPTNTVVRLKLARILLVADHVAEARQQVIQALEVDPTNLEGLLLLSDASRETDDVVGALAVYEKARAQHADDPFYHVGLGNLHLKRHKPEMAEKAYQHAVGLNVTNAAAQAALAKLYAGQGKRNEARVHFEKAVSFAGPDSLEAMAFARFLLQEGDLERARVLLSKALQSAPENPFALSLLAQAAFLQKDYDTCLEYAEKILAKNPGHVGAATLRADVNAALGSPDAAIAEYEKLVARLPKSAKLHYGLARALLAKGDTRRAASELKAALDLEPRNMAYALILAEAQLTLGNIVAATQLLEKLMEEGAPQRTVYVRLASAYRAAKRYEDALTVLRRLCELSPEDPEALYSLGLTQHAAGNNDAATRALKKAVELKPGFLPALTQLALLDLEANKHADAVALIEAQILDNPKDAGLRYLLGRIHVANKNWEAAERELLKTIDLSPQFAGAYVLLGQVYRATGNIPKTLTKLDAALAINPNDTSALMLSAGLHIVGGNEAKAIGLYQQLLKTQPTSISALNNLAVLYSRQPGRLDEAYALAQKARDVAPQDASVADTLGWIQHLRGDHKSAVGLLRQSAEKNPWHPEIQYHLGLVECALGNEKAALTALEAALSAEGDEFGVRDKTEALAGILRIDRTKQFDGPTVARLESVVREDPGNVAALIRLGAASEQAGEWKVAEQHYRRAVASQSGHVLALKALSELYLLRLNNAKDALDVAKQLRDAAPEDDEALILLGRAAYENGDFKWASSLIRESVRSAPENPLPWYYLGLADYACGRLGKAEEALKRVSVLRSDLPEAADARRILSLMDLCHTGKRGDAAKRLIESSLAANERDIPALMARAALLVAAKDVNGACDSYERITRLAPGFAPAMAELARLYTGMEDRRSEAMVLAKKARELLPDDPSMAGVLGTVASQQGDHAWAVSLLGEALRGTEPTAELLYRLGESEFHCENKAAAREHLRHALRIANADFPYREQAERMIKELE